MPIRRPRGPKPALKHVEFLAAASRQPAKSPERAALEAAFLTLRLLDEWIASGGMLADPLFPAHAATRTAVEALSHDTETQLVLWRVIDAITTLHDPDAQPVLPRVYAYAGLLERRGELRLAADVYATVSRYVDSRAHLDLGFDALMMQGLCFRGVNELERAGRAYENAGMLAGRAHDRSRILYARIGEAKVTLARGDHATAQNALGKILAEAAVLGNASLHDIALAELTAADGSSAKSTR